MRVLQIGAGGWGKNHTRVLDELGVLVGVCDPSDEVSERITKFHKGVFVYKTLDEAFRVENFDTVFICTPTVTHFDIASMCLNAGKNVFVEKPMVYDPIEGEALIKLAKVRGVKLSCGYIERFNPAVQQVKKIIDTKELGELLQVEFHRENQTVHIKDVGIIHDTSVHDIDTANFLFGNAPKRIFAHAGKYKHEHEDHAIIHLEYENGVAVITSNWITPSKIRNFTATFVNGVVTGNFLTQQITIHTKDNSVTPKVKFQEPLRNEIESFLKAVETNTEPLVTPRQAVDVSAIASIALDSSKEGKVIEY
jgi:UDP-N-acetylglucosamine 3-dehydrogenase